MSPNELLQVLETIGDAPEGIERLRQVVLQLAVAGQLTPRDLDDESAEHHLRQVRKELHALSRKHGVRNRAPTSLDPDTPLPGPLQVGWTAARLVDLGLITSGKTPSKAKTDYWGGSIPWVSPKDMKSDFIVEAEDSVTKKAVQDGLKLVPAGSVLVVVRSGILRRMVPVAVTRIDCTTNQDIKALICCPTVCSEYIALMLRGFQTFILETLTKTGTTVESMKADEFIHQPFPLPPLGEQRRIVAKVDDLMALLDELERARDERDAHRAAFRDSALAALQNAEDAEAAHAAWSRIAANLADCITDPGDIAPLRQTILQLAVRGRLVPQNQDDTPATQFADESGWEGAAAALLPNGWVPSRLGVLLADGLMNGWSPKAVEVETDVRTLKLSATTRGRFDSTQFKYVDVEPSTVSKYMLKRGDLLVQRSNTPEYVGVSALYEGEDDAFMFPDLMMRGQIAEGLDARFVHIGMSAPSARAYLAARASGTSGSMVKLSQSKVCALPIPLPPLAEQRRIVERVNELLAICDELEQGLAEAKTHQSAFAAAAVHHLDQSTERASGFKSNDTEGESKQIAAEVACSR